MNRTLERITISHNPLIVIEAIPNFDADHTVNIRATRDHTIVFDDDIPECDAERATTRLIGATRVLAATIRRYA